MRTPLKEVMIFVLAAILGLTAVIISPLVTPGAAHYDSTLFPWVRTGIENGSLATLGFLLIAGMIPGFLDPKRFWLWGLATMSFLPIWAIAEMVVESINTQLPASHNLWPLEFVLYGLGTLPGLVGAGIGAILGWLYSKISPRK